MTSEHQLRAVRERIDTIDQAILGLISQRAACAQEVARIKQASGGDSGFYRPEREAQVLKRVIERNPGPLSGEEMARLFREIMSACLALERRLKIAYFGPAGSFTHAAALKHFGHSVEAISLGAIDLVFREVESGAAHYGVVPVENSTEGVVNHTLDMFVNSPLKICGEVELRIHHHLLGMGSSLEGVRRVYSHQQSLAQCREWLDMNLRGIERISVSNNAEAARRVRDEPDAVAIAGSMAAEIYGLNAVVSNIEDEPENTTRFMVIGNHDTPPSGADKTSVLVSAHNKPGALVGLLEPLARHRISLTRIESRPSRRGMWEYVFFVDLEGHQRDAQVAHALAELEQTAAMIKVLGSYPKAVL